MKNDEVKKYWNKNAHAWTSLAREGLDIHRDFVNTPAFFEMLPDIKGKEGLDIGCGEGHNTRLLCNAGAGISAVDISDVFIEYASEFENNELGINYQVASGSDLPFDDNSFDFATAFMSFMDMPNHEQVIKEAHRVIRPGGFLQFSIAHPCFFTPRWRWLTDENNRRVGMDCGDYWNVCNGEIEQWMFSSANDEQRAQFDKFAIPRFGRTLADWMNLLIETGMTIEQLKEPTVSDEDLKKHPLLADSRVIAYFLIVRCRKNL